MNKESEAPNGDSSNVVEIFEEFIPFSEVVHLLGKLEEKDKKK